MIKSALSAILIMGFLISCASSPELDDEVVESKASSQKAKSEAPQAPKVATVSPDSNQLFSEALASQNEAQIQLAAERVLVEQPLDARALNAVAMSNYKKGRFEVSKNLLVVALKQRPDSAEMHSNFGLVLYSMGERFEGIKELRKAIELKPDHAQANATLGSIYVQQKDFSKASIVLETAYLKGVRDLKTLNNYAITLGVRGQTSLAKELYEKILKESPHDKEVMMNYAILLVENLNSYREGLDLINRLKFVGVPLEAKPRILALENKAKAGLK